MTLAVLVLIGLIVYMASMLLIGWLATRRVQKTAEEYYVASRLVGSFLQIWAMAAANYSAFLLMGQPGLSFTFGWSVFALLVPGVALGVPVWYYTIGQKAWKLGKKYGFHTATDIMAARYESPLLAAWMGIVIMIFMMPFMSTQFIGMGYIVNTLTQGLVPFWVGVLLAAVIMAFLALWGARSIIWVAAMQGLIFSAVLIVLFAVSASNAGGLVQAATKLAQDFPGVFSRAGIGGKPWLFGTYISWFVCYLILLIQEHHLFRVVYFPSSLKVLRRNALAFPLLGAILGFLAFGTGVYAKAIYPNLAAAGIKSADQIVPKLVSVFWPWGSIFIVWAVLAAAMSTLEAIFLSFSAVFVKDIVQPFRKSPITEKQSILYGKLFSIFIILVLIFVAFRPTGLIGLIALVGWGGVIQVFPATLAGFFWPRANKYAAAISSVAGVGLYVYLTHGIKYKPPYGFDNYILAFIVASILLVVFSYLIKKEPSAEVKQMFFQKKESS